MIIERTAILRIVARIYGVTVKDILGDDRDALIARAKFTAVQLLSEAFGKSPRKLGRLMGGRDRSTMQHALKRARSLNLVDSDFRDRLAKVRHELNIIPRPLKITPIEMPKPKPKPAPIKVTGHDGWWVDESLSRKGLQQCEQRLFKLVKKAHPGKFIREAAE